MEFENLAPVALFAFNRPVHLEKTLTALKCNNLASSSELFIFCDGPRSEKDAESVKKVRDIAKSVKGFRKIIVIESPSNKGLAASIIKGVSDLCTEFGKVIVVEDDLITSKYFLEYMNEGLQKYLDSEEIISIHGYIYPLKNPMNKPFFLRGADCWGWATWDRGWRLFNPDAKYLLDQITEKKMRSRFDFNNSFPYTKMLQENIEGKNNSWAIRWYASAFLENKLTLYPHISLVHNIGLDDSGTHCSSEKSYDSDLAIEKIVLPSMPYIENEQAFIEIQSFFNKRSNFISRVTRFIYSRFKF